MIRQVLLIGSGGALGAVLRYSIAAFLPYQGDFPTATLLVNLLGCFLLAYSTSFLAWRNLIPKELVLAVNTGFIGSFTTFSTFSLETVSLWNASPEAAIAYVIISIFGGLSACLLGFQLARQKGKSV